MLLPVAVADKAMLPVFAVELEDTATELDDLLEEITELETWLEELATTELDDLLDELTTTELEDLLLDDTDTELGADEEVFPHVDDVSVAPFLPTPATPASLSFTHCGATGE